MYVCVQSGSDKYQSLSQRDDSILRGKSSSSSSSGRGPVLDEVVNPLHSESVPSTTAVSSPFERPPQAPMKTQTSSGVQADISTGGIASSAGSGSGVGYQKLEEDTDELL